MKKRMEALILDKESNKAVEGFAPISERVMMLHIKCNIIQVYPQLRMEMKRRLKNVIKK